MSIGKAIATIFGGTFAAKAARETRIADLLQKKSILVVSNIDLLEEVAALKAQISLLEVEREGLQEEAAAARLRHTAALQALDKARADATEARRVAGLTLKNFEIYQDAVKMLVERGALSAIECAQLNLGTFIPGVDGLPPSIEFGDVTEGKTSVDFGMKSQATEAKYRQTKEHFQRYQSAVGVMLDRLNDLGKANHVTKEDLRKLRELRLDLSKQIKRSI